MIVQRGALNTHRGVHGEPLAARSVDSMGIRSAPEPCKRCNDQGWYPMTDKKTGRRYKRRCRCLLITNHSMRPLSPFEVLTGQRFER